MEYYLLQNYKDKRAKMFLDGKIEADVYFEMDLYLDNRKKFFTVWLS